MTSKDIFPIVGRSFAVLAAIFAPICAHSLTHCKKSEVDYFSCPIAKSNKVVSLCGNIDDGVIDESSWIQYRFGPINKIELAYPAERKGSVSRFEGNNFDRYNIVEVRFINQGMGYGVALNDVYAGDGEAPARPGPSGDVTVESPTQKNVNIACAKANAKKYYYPLSRLAAALRQHNGETDFLFDLYHKKR